MHQNTGMDFEDWPIGQSPRVGERGDSTRFVAGWAEQQAPSGGRFVGVWGSSATDVYAVGGAGTLLHYDGTAWTTLTSGTTAPLRAVWGASPADVFAAGNGGVVLHFDGTNWNPLGSGTTTTLMALWGTSGSEVYALNSGGALFRYNGSGWSALGANPALSSRLLAGTSGSDLYAVGSGGMRRWDGSTWTAIANGSSGVMYGIWVSGSNHLYAVGSLGTVLQGLRGATVEVTGAGWTATSQGMQQQLTATAKDAAATAVSGVAFAWTSSKPEVATVDAAGLVTAVDRGEDLEKICSGNLLRAWQAVLDRRTE